MRCSSCGSDNREGRKFCAGCGAELTLACVACGSKNRSGERFCGECGKPLAGTAQPAQSPDPRSYTPKHLAEKILSSRSALEGERKQVTVLFADVKGSMDLAEQVDPEEWHRIMDRFFQILTDGVHRLEGTINQYTGDGIMALFGAPIAHEDHARAIPRDRGADLSDPTTPVLPNRTSSIRHPRSNREAFVPPVAAGLASPF